MRRFDKYLNAISLHQGKELSCLTLGGPIDLYKQSSIAMPSMKDRET